MTDEKEVERLLRFLYLCPIGLAEHSVKGEVRMLNALAVQMLMPLARDGRMDNVFTVLAEAVPDLPTLVGGYGPPFGTVVQDRVFPVRIEQTPRHYALSVLRIGRETFMATLSDVTQAVAYEGVARAALRAQAAQEGRVEILTGILHDIGNGITGMGTRTAILGASPRWEELDQLEKLGPFLRQNPAALEAALGAAKAAALLRFVDAVANRFQQRATEWRETVELFSKSILHIQEILNIQRHFVHGGAGAHRPPFPAELVETALAIQHNSLRKRGVEVTTEFDSDLGSLAADRTQIIQVFVNVLKNVTEAFDANGDKSDCRTLRILVHRVPHGRLEFAFVDNACGFDVPGGAFTIVRGQTTKSTGSGLGLSSCAQVIASHHGTFTLRSPGRGCGATCSVVLPVLTPVEGSPPG